MTFLSRPRKMVIRVDQMRMERHHDSQRSDRLALTFGELRVVDRVVASIASLPRLGSDGSEMKRHDDSQRSGRWPVMFGDLRVVERVVAPTLSCLAWGRRMPMKRHDDAPGWRKRSVTGCR